MLKLLRSAFGLQSELSEGRRYFAPEMVSTHWLATNAGEAGFERPGSGFRAVKHLSRPKLFTRSASRPHAGDDLLL
jgi:hypothetical protein